MNGQGVAKDEAEALRLFRQSAEKKNSRAQVAMGMAYQFEWLGLKQDYSEAAKWYRLSAEQGLAHAQFRLGYLYDTGKGITANRVEANRLYGLAATQGDKDAQKQLSINAEIAELEAKISANRAKIAANKADIKEIDSARKAIADHLDLSERLAAKLAPDGTWRLKNSEFEAALLQYERRVNRKVNRRDVEAVQKALLQWAEWQR